MRVLFVDDEPLLLRAIARELKRETYELLFADSVRDALRTIAAVQIDIVVADFRMPDLTGLELCRKLRVDRPSTSLVVMTGSIEEQALRDAHRDGIIDWFLEKPWPQNSMKDLLRAIGSVRAQRTSRPE